MSIDQLTAEALALPPKDRATPGLKLWESIPDPKGADWDPEHLQEVLRRAEELRSGKVG